MAQFTNGAISELLQKILAGTGEPDLLFQVGPESVKVHAHSFVVLESSAVFKAMLSGRWDQKNKDGVVVVDLPDDDPENFRTLVKLMYGSSAFNTDDFDLIFSLYRLADKYEAPEVQKFLSDLSVSLARAKLSVGNVMEIYKCAKEHGVQGLISAAVQYMANNIRRLWMDEEWLDLDTEAMISILDHNSLCGLDLESISLRCVTDCCKPKCNNSNCSRTNYHSQNETLILGKVIQWIKHKASTKNEAAGLGDHFTQHIRFSALTTGDFVDWFRGTKELREIATNLGYGDYLEGRLPLPFEGGTPLASTINRRTITLPNAYGFCPRATGGGRRPFIFQDGIYLCPCTSTVRSKKLASNSRYCSH